MYSAGPALDELLDRLHAMGCPAPRWGRINGRHDIYLEVVLPVGNTERVAPTLDACARAVLDLDLSCPDRDQENAQASLT